MGGGGTCVSKHDNSNECPPLVESHKCQPSHTYSVSIIVVARQAWHDKLVVLLLIEDQFIFITRIGSLLTVVDSHVHRFQYS